MFFAVIDEKEKETLSEHETQLASIRWHLSEGKFMFLRMELDFLIVFMQITFL